ncbi:outer membrane beta-barrel family protein [Anditalea andensis]|uniref:TonB-dependent receptor n=1 Tax=Anditalea andensis TaxID=1048983 RepID=A0A074KWG9_9BACT|nr:outer membrane beta-barrel family protein [Anditalea andensis]KEO71953.1 TonB-dependent receptor [Anditalea andensis]
MKLSNYLFPIVLIFLMGSSQVVAQQSLSGQIKSVEGETLPFVNVSLLEEGTLKLVTGSVSDENGNFQISTSRTGRFKLQLSMIGFETHLSTEFDLKSGEKKNFNVLTMEAEVAALGEVTVSSTRPNIVIQADKTIVNVEGTVMAEGSTALDVIGRSPGIYVDADGNINLNGRSGITVLIDDRQTYMSATDLANFLRSMPADNIKSLEVISNPSARFDAEGSAGVLNIKLKKNSMNGVNGNVQIGHQYNGKHAPFTGATVNVRSGKWTSNASLNYNEYARPMELEIFRRFQLPEGISDFDQNATIGMRRRNVFFSGGTDYQINEKHSVGMSIQASGSRAQEDGNSLTNISNPLNEETNFLQALNDENSGSQRFFTNLHYMGNLDTLGTKLSADIDFTIMDTESTSLLNNSYWVDERQNLTTDRILTANEMQYTIFTAKVDFTKPLKKGKVLETGLKGSWVRSDNVLDIQRAIAEAPLQQDPSSNEFLYHENVWAAYVSLKGNISSKLDYQAGLRGEYSDIIGNSLTMQQINTQQYFDLFPSIYLQHKVSDQYQIVYNANRRITRPNYRLLNPFVFYIDPLTTERGNPQLTPQYANNFEMNHIIKGSYQFTLSYSRMYDSFNQVMEQNDETRETVIQIQNLDRADNFSLRMMVPFEIAEWWNTSNMVQVYYNRFQSPLGNELLDMEQVSGMFRSQHNIKLPKGFKMEVMGMYLTPFLEGQVKIQGVGWVDAGMTKSFNKDKLSLTLNATDVFRTQVFRVNVLFDQIDTSIRQYNGNQGVRLTLRYRFSQGESFRVSNRSGSSEERDRLD